MWHAQRMEQTVLVLVICLVTLTLLVLVAEVCVAWADRWSQQLEQAAGQAKPHRKAWLKGLAQGLREAPRVFFAPVRPAYWHRVWRGHTLGGWPGCCQALFSPEKA